MDSLELGAAVRSVPAAQEASERDAVIVEAISWLKTPYHHAARIKGAGVDCAMLLAEVYRNCNLIPKIEDQFYAPQWALNQREEKYLSWVERYAAPVETPKPADVILFKVGHCFSHGGIITAWPKIIHAAQADRGVCHADAHHCHRLMSNKDGTMREHVFFSLWK